MKETNQELVTIEKGTPVTTSLKIAELFGKQHKNVLAAIEKLECSEEFTRLNFKPSEYKDSTGRNLPMVYVTRKGFMFLGMGFNGKKAAEFKVAIIEAFDKMHEYILSLKSNQQSQTWIQARHEGIAARKGETDVISEFVAYAIGQGSKSAHWYYKHFTTVTYKALFIVEDKHPSLRPLLTTDQLGNLMTAERMIQRKIKGYMAEGIHYKKIFENLKSDLLAYAALIGTSRVALPEPVAFQPKFLLGV